MIHLPHYTLTDLLHESAIAAVYRGYRNADGALVTVKLLAGDPGPQAMERLRHEYAILQGIDAPPVVRPVALEKHEGGLALVLEGLAGTALDELVTTAALDLPAVLEIGVELGRALAAVHRAGVVHRDVKPANVIVDLDTRVVKLIDFGIATWLAEQDTGIDHPGLEGSLAYLSPEQTGRMDRIADARADLYSFGVTLYEMLTGMLPFVSSDPVDLVHAHLTRVPPAPCRIAPGVPAVVSDIVMKLLEKAPEARYQSASGLLFDLERCLSELRATGAMELFALGSRDTPAELSAPDRVYGREAERAALRDATERAARGTRELVVVEGPSGIGKSALVRELVPAVVAHNGHFICGKCDQNVRSAPYAPVIDALRDLCRHIMTGSETERLRLQGELCRALGSNGQILVDLVPELERIIGPQERAPELEAAEAQNRLGVIFEGALGVLSSPEHPLVVFLDDLQWADPGTLWLLGVLLTADTVRGLLIIGAVRDDAMVEPHPLRTTLATLGKQAVAVTAIRLGPLKASDLRRFVADILHARDDEVAELATVLLSHTGGNPFYAFRLLRALHEGSALVREPDHNLFTIDRERFDAVRHKGDIVELVAGELEKLPVETRQLLALAAAIGHRFDRTTLSLLCKRPEADVDAILVPAVRAGHILPIERAEAQVAQASGHPTKAHYRFAHDRLQQAAFVLFDEQERRHRALDIGRILLERAEQTGRDEDWFDAADHLNEGAALMVDPHERTGLASIHLRAGRKARIRAAFETAANYFKHGVSLLDEHSFERDHDLAFALHSELAECEASRGDAHAALDRLGRLDRHARTPLEQARAAAIRVGLYALVGRFPDAVRAGGIALHAFGIVLPETEEARKAALQDVLARAAEDLATRPPASRLSAPDMTDLQALALERLLVGLIVPAYLVDPTLLGVLMIAWVDLVTARGHSDLSAMGYASYGFFLSFFPERQRDAYEIGKLALALNDKRGNRALLCKVMETFAGNIAFLHEPIRSVLARFPEARQAGLESGDFTHAAHICGHIVGIRIGVGDPLGAIAEQAAEFLPLLERTGQTFSVAIMRLVRQVVKNLEGTTTDRASLSDEAVDEQQIAALAQSEGFDHFAAFYHTLRLMLLVVHGLWDKALDEAHVAEAKRAHAAGQFFLTDLTWFAALARIRAAGEDIGRSPVLAEHTENLRAWAELCPANYRHKHLLVLAELARNCGDELSAMRLYDEAIHAARDHEFVRDEALASELSAEFHRERGRARIADAYGTDAFRLYAAWGAAAKAKALAHSAEASRHGLRARTRSPASPAPELAFPITLTNTAGKRVSALLDMFALIRAAQAIAGEIFLPRVIEKLLRIVAGSAGAERGQLVLDDQGAWVIAARIGPDGVETGLHIPLDEATGDLATSVVRHVAAAQEPVILADAPLSSPFALDPYIVRNQPKSILCMETAHKGRRPGIVYLENNALHGAFGKERIEPLRILLSQAAVAIDTGKLYEQLEGAREKLCRVHAGLEDQVAQRTALLQGELVARAQTERERAILAEEAIRVREERIAELSAPLLPISDEVAVMPLIGGMDVKRAARMLEAALEGAAKLQAKAVIIDVTGVPSANPDVAMGLIRTARALRLLGTEAVLTGVHAAVARTLADLGTDLRTLVIKSTLKAGIEHAMRKDRPHAV